MCQQRNIKVISHTNTTDLSKQLNKSKLHLNKYRTTEFAKNFKNFLCRLNWRDLDNSRGFDQHDANFPNFVGNTLHSDHNDNLNENGREESILFSEYDNNNDNKNLIGNLTNIRSLNPSKVLNDTRHMNSNRLVIAQLNINSLRNKSTSLSTMIKDNVDILLISETKIHSSFPITPFHIDGYTIYRRDTNENGVGLLLYIRDYISSTLLKIDPNFEAFYGELNVRKRKSLLSYSYNPNKNLINKHLDEISRNLDLLSSKYDNFVIPGLLNLEHCEQRIKNFFHFYNYQNIIKEKML